MINYRPARHTDSDAIAKIHANSWKQNYRGIFSDRYLDLEADKERAEFWYARLQSPASNQHVIVAAEEGVLVGFVCILLNHDPLYGALADNLHVLKEKQQSGIGRTLLGLCADKINLPSNGFDMYLWVFEANINAQQAYTRLGAVYIETVEHTNPDQTKSNACRYAWKDERAAFRQQQ